MGKKILTPYDLTSEQFLYHLERWAEHMKPYKHEVVECGVAGIVFTEKAPDMPFERLSYSFTPEGILKILGFGSERESDVIIEYDSLEIGYRSLTDPDYDTFQALAEGKFRVPEEAMKMVPVFPRMREAWKKAMADTEENFSIELQRY